MLVGQRNRQGLGSPPPINVSCILVHFGNGHYYLFTYYSFRFIAYILTCRAWKRFHCIYRPTLWPFNQPLLFDQLLLFWYWDKSWSLSYSVHFLWHWCDPRANFLASMKSCLCLIDSKNLASLHWRQHGRRPWLGGGLYFEWPITSLAQIIDVQTHLNSCRQWHVCHPIKRG
jgi:hypothetical protein